MCAEILLALKILQGWCDLRKGKGIEVFEECAATFDKIIIGRHPLACAKVVLNLMLKSIGSHCAVSHAENPPRC